MKQILRSFSKAEWILWGASVGAVLLSFLLFDRENPLLSAVSLIGVTSLIFIAKGNPVGQLLCAVFGVFYGILSLSCAYYSEVITYLSMTAPMALLSLFAWLKNPYRGNRAEVKINRLRKIEYGFAFLLTGLVTTGFYFVLSAIGTAELLTSTFSIATSFLAMYLTFRRSPYYALAYAANDVVLLVLWGVAAMRDRAYLSMVVNFAVFLVNDLYAFCNWRRLRRRQERA